ncbi:DHA2 family efflux MFS transporter permease subunit [Conexibacter sp. CPCC 206217]|uniref:DHA2 family efflux MFS transporter permease subunit n=1 Tax=Conexibacter sp. CPCC 206217 TaxID=3064574 RepID=UPI00271875A3|nr:DHA2 family efflux MFS transporter permease subunit [Conexibacter sp. CPCC 206217]MDO8213769.1 DHA2 family efflux MFS transporter permease subunit [Conexibacter sp. CPCC 206217]
MSASDVTPDALTPVPKPTRRERRAAKRGRVRVNPTAEALQSIKWRVFGVMMIAWFMTMLDLSIMNTALPELQHDFETVLPTASWVVNVYNIVFAVLLIATGRLADQFGRKKMFVGGLIVFTAGSALCAVSWDIGWLIGFRAFQAVGAGMIAPLGFAMTALVFPPRERGKGLAMIAVVALVANGLGPVIGGGLIEIASWHWIFIINLPLGVIGVLLALRWWPETYDLTSNRRIDWIGMGLLAAAVSLFTYGLVEANVKGWDDAQILFFIQLSIVLGIGFVFWQHRARNPMIPPALMRNRQFLSANLAMVILAGGAVGGLFLLAQTFVNLWGFSQLEAGLSLLPIGICGGLVWPLVGRAADNAPAYRLAIPALASLAIGLTWMSFMPSTYEGVVDYLSVLPGLVFIGMGIGIGFPTLNVGAMNAAMGPQIGVASGVVNTSRQLGSALGIALLITVFTSTSAIHFDIKRDHLEDTAYVWAVPKADINAEVSHNLAEFAGAVPRRETAPVGFDRWVRRESAGIARDGFGWSFRVAALLLLLMIPVARRLTLTPVEARANAAILMQQAAARAAAAPPGPGGDGANGAPAGVPVPVSAPAVPAGTGAVAAGNGGGVEGRIADLEAALAGLRAEVADGRERPR